ncbi:hypothetical protein Q5691_05905 [Microcoleus sp. w1-18aA5]|uniref:hypothetical protein n=1 Tax=unclassified Microcoleus TaxID=2642155 RepID=UPI002FD06C1E
MPLRIASPKTPECHSPPVLGSIAPDHGIHQEFALAPLQNGDQVLLISPVSYPPLPSDSRPRAIGLSPGGRSS